MILYIIVKNSNIQHKQLTNQSVHRINISFEGLKAE